MTTKWYNTDEGKQRLAQERQAIQAAFPDVFCEYLDPDSGQVYYEGTLRSNTGHTYDLTLILPDDYPYSFARPYITNPEFVEAIRRSHSTHIFTETGMLCLHDMKGSRHAFDTWLVDLIGWTAEHLYNLENIWTGGSWLSPEAPFNG